MGTTMFLPRVIVFHQDHAAFMVTKLVGYKTISLVFFYTGVVACSKRLDSGERCGVKKGMKSRGGLKSIPDKERFAVQDDTPDVSLPPANSGMLSVHPFFSLWTSSKHAVLCSPNQQKQNVIRFMISMSFYAKTCQGLQRNTVVGISLWCNCTYLQVRELFQLQFPLWSL